MRLGLWGPALALILGVGAMAHSQQAEIIGKTQLGVTAGAPPEVVGEGQPEAADDEAQDGEAPPSTADEAQPEAADGVVEDGEAQPEVIDEVVIEGARVADPDHLRAMLSQQVGEPLDGARVDLDLRAIYALGLFDDVRVEVRREAGRTVLVVVVVERPLVVAVRFEGGEALGHEALREAAAWSVFSPLSPAALVAAGRRIEARLAREGHALASVGWRAEPVAGVPEHVTLIFEVAQGPRVVVRAVGFVGNAAFSDDALAEVLETRLEGPLSGWTRRGVLDAEALARDRERLEALYRRHGHLDARVSPAQVRLSNDRRGAWVTFVVEEGAARRVGRLAMEGELPAPASELMALLSLVPGAPLDMEAVRRDAARLRLVMQDEGFAQAEVTPRPTQGASPDEVDLTFELRRGPRVRVGRVLVEGNTRTRDRVIRRELSLAEGDVLRAVALREAREGLLGLRLFSAVDLETRPGAAPDVMDLVLRVEEPERWWPDAALGLTPSGDLAMRLTARNLLGGARSVSAQVVLSDVQRRFSARLADPRLFDTRWAASVEVYNQEVELADLSRRAVGGRLHLGRAWRLEADPLDTAPAPAWSLSPGWRLESLGVALAGPAPLFDEGLTSAPLLALGWDDRDHPLLATRGRALELTLEVAHALTGSDNQFVRAQLTGQQFVGLTAGLRLRFMGLLGHVRTLAGDQLAPERFFLGGPDSHRGFGRGLLGPVRRVAAPGAPPDAPLTEVRPGGATALSLGSELLWAVPDTGERLHVAVFFDVGQAFDDGVGLGLRPDLLASPGDGYARTLRTAAGVGVWWISPLGPLRVDLGAPLQPLPGVAPWAVQLSGGF